MRNITKPTLRMSEVVSDCIQNLSNENLKQDIIDSLTLFDDAEDDFEEKKKANNLFQIVRNVVISNTINAQVLKDIYTDRMVNKKNTGRTHYNSILMSAPSGRCPLCGQRIATTLDHYLPKADYPILATSPINLIPACTDCNKGKLSNYPTAQNEETLHPYYDDVDQENWLKMELKGCSPMIFNFYTNPPVNWSNLLQVRAKYHFDSFKLNDLYISHAAEEFENVKKQLTKLFNKGGEELLKEHLLDSLESRLEINLNSWQSAFYSGLLTDQDFCSGLFI